MIRKLRLLITENPRIFPGMVIIGVLVILLVLRFGYARHRENLEEIAAYREALKASSLMLARSDGIKTRIEAGEKDLKALEKGLLKARGPSMAAAELQEAFKRLTTGRDITIRSENVLGFEDAGQYMKIPVEFHLKTALSELTRLLYEIEASPLVMGVRSMHITVPYSRESGDINVTLVLEGAIRKGKGGGGT